MCGRFVSASPPDEIAQYFDADGRRRRPSSSRRTTWPRPTTCTSSPRTAASAGSTRSTGAWCRSGPRTPAAAAKMINARAETLADKNAYKRAFAKRRAASSRPTGSTSGRRSPAPSEAAVLHQPPRRGAVRLRRAVGGLAGQGRRGQRRAGEPLRSSTIITTTPNETMAQIHDRMPVILPPSAWDEWLDPDNDDLDDPRQAAGARRPPTLIRSRRCRPRSTTCATRAPS